MRIYVNALIVIGILFSSSIFAKGKIKIKSDLVGGYLFVNEKKKAMLGTGLTIISLDEGDYNISIQKDIDEHSYFEGNKKIFVGDDTEMEIIIPYKKRIKKQTLGKYICKEGINTVELISDGSATINIRMGSDISSFEDIFGKFKDNQIVFTIKDKKITLIINGDFISMKDTSSELCEKIPPLVELISLSKNSKIFGKWKEKKDPRVTQWFKNNGEVIYEKKYGSKDKRENINKWKFVSNHYIKFTNSYGNSWIAKLHYINNDEISLYSGERKKVYVRIN